MNLSAVLRANSLTMGQAARILDVDKSTVSKVCSRTYHKWEEKEAELVEKLASLGYDKSASDSLSVNTNVLVKTRSVSLFFDLCDDLADPESSLSSSLGMAIGTAERGKTHAAKWYASENESAAYTLYVDGFSRVQLLRNICCELAGVRPFSFGSCVSTIAEVSKVSRRLIIVDEADKCPVPLLEMLRGVNESCGIPVVLVGEERLKAKIDAVPRLRSRIRKPLCVFDPINTVDVAVYYSEALGVSLDKALAENLSRRAAGGFRTVANDSLALAKIARASGLSAITPAMLDRLG
ncbi:AAA family ATPase [Treponema endosymbiont of Eucomonympha sp.]|uniref:AAA family ATPase n=1 Tax=Treponema endosymbiont of Eucomonympha sp. TaxID=1580831 RepID=UPI000A876C66|nr:AAA family ATPase [Treponema endosymbiont of Eucomonympha sp.]